MEKSLMARLVSSFSVLSFTTVTLVGTVAFIRAKVELRNLVFERLTAIANLKEDALDLWVEAQQEATVSLAQLSEVRSQAEILLTRPENDPQSQSAHYLLMQYFNSAMTSRPELEEVFILTKVGGQIRLSTDEQIEGEYRVKNRYFTEGLKRTFVQNVYPSTATGRPTMTISTPLYALNGELIGVLGAHLNLERMDRIILERTGLGEKGEAYLVDRFNLFVSAERFGRQEFPRGVHSWAIDRALKAEDGFSIYRNYNNVSVIGVYRWLDDRELALLVEVETLEAFAPARQLAGTIFLVGLAATGFLAVGVYLLARQIARPILAINQAATQVAKGDLTAIAPTLTEDEVGVLATTFNQMTQQLQRSSEQTASYSRSLEQKASQLEQALVEVQSYQAQLVQSEKMSSLGQLVAGVAHEINNPVSFIHGNLPHAVIYIEELCELIQLYQEHYPQPHSAIEKYRQEVDLDFILEDLPSLLDSMKVGTDRIRQIVLSLRNFSRLDESDRKAVNLHEGLENTLLILQHRLKSAGDRSDINIIRDYEDLPQVECFVGQLNQVFMNLLANALDALENCSKFETQAHSFKETAESPEEDLCYVSHLPPDRPTILLKTRLLETQWVQIAIADNGSGISPAVRQRLFDPFFTTKPVGKGTGLGLSISYKIIVEKHQGKIYCRSAVGKGTEFMMEIPLKIAPTLTLDEHFLTSME
uniref:Sensor histidine kinase n=1 Tax=Desertifilum tharense IPPAS B-1220 TaxID=1781255 RepID=A0ACD5GSF7_9CYAN